MKIAKGGQVERDIYDAQNGTRLPGTSVRKEGQPSDGDGDGEIFNRFTLAIDVVGHELSHGVTESEAGLVNRPSPMANRGRTDN